MDMDSPFNQIKFAKFQFVLRAEDMIHLPSYKGSTLRGAFGHAFKKIVCISRGKACESCLLKEKCVYSYIFETPPPSGSIKMRKYPYAPHPFIITPPLEEKRIYRQDETFCFELLLVGKSMDYLPYFIYTFDELGRMGIGKGRGKYQLEEVKAIQFTQMAKDIKDIDESEEKRGQKAKVNGEGNRKEDKRTQEKIIYSKKDKVLHNNFEVLQINDSFTFDPLPNTLHLSFLTPTRLKFDGRLSPRLEFHILLRNLLRRISLLSYFHCGEELALDFKGLIERSKDIKIKEENLRWLDWERYSNRQETKMKMGGFIGTVIFEGDLEKFMPFLLLGEHVHVGKGTSFGLGKYKILNLEY